MDGKWNKWWVLLLCLPMLPVFAWNKLRDMLRRKGRNQGDA